MQLRSTCRVLSRKSLLVFPALAMCFSWQAFAHHSPAAFDMSQESVVEGVISEVSWRNPHVYITVATTGANGEKIEQEIEGAAASSLIAYGVQPADLAVGERVSVKVNPNRRGPGHEALGLVLTRQNGDVVAFRAGTVAATLPQVQASSLDGTWTPDAASFIALSRSSQVWPFTQAGAQAAADLAARSKAAADCQPFGIPVIMTTPEVRMVTVADDRITFIIDGVGIRREVHIATEFPHEMQPSPLGYSIGHWEEQTLVVETTGFVPDPEGLGFALPSSAKKHVFERFTLGADRRNLNYEATLEDPEYLTEPVSIKTTWAYRPDLQPSGQDCDMESAVRFQAAP